MRLPVPPRYKYIGFWLSMPAIVGFLCYILYGERIFSDWRIWLVAFPLIYLMGYISWRLHYVYDHYVHTKYPSLSETRKRVMLTIPIILLVMTPSIIIIFYTFHAFGILGYQLMEDDLLYGFLVGLGVNIIFESLWEVIYIIEKYKESAAEKEMIEQMQLRQAFDQLKEKVNPHFLFNSFNTLSSLIFEDKQKAILFLDELSKVYRYLLRNNESGLSTLGQEIQFIQSYTKLLSTRYGDGFRLIMDIDPACLEKEVPTLSLQLLVENAVKHNIISKENPLVVYISTLKDSHLVIHNSLQLKMRSAIDSTGIGLSNIREKYKLLQRKDVLVEQSADDFTVKIPLL